MSFIIGVIIWLLRLVSIAIIVYCVLGFVTPSSALVQKAKPYLEPVLAPFRALIEKYLPALGKLSFDMSPIAAILVIELAVLVLRLLQRIF